MIVLTANQVDELCVFIETRIEQAGCDHSRRYTMEWAEKNEINKADLIDVLDENGGYCDCEVAMNLPEDIDLKLLPENKKADAKNPFKIPENFQPNLEKTYSKAVFSNDEFGNNNYTKHGELLIPAPFGYKPKKRVKKSMHFFHGIESEMPTIFGVVGEIKPTNAKDFAKMIRDTQLKSMSSFSERDAAYYLSKIDTIPVEKPMGIHFMEKTGIGGTKIILRIHKVMFFGR